MNTEKSEELAECINSIKMMLWIMDIAYAKEAVEAMRNQASFEDSAAVLNPMYNPEKTRLITEQAKMLEHLIQFVEIGKQVDEMKKSVNQYSENQRKIMQMFS